MNTENTDKTIPGVPPPVGKKPTRGNLDSKLIDTVCIYSIIFRKGC